MKQKFKFRAFTALELVMVLVIIAVIVAASTIAHKAVDTATLNKAKTLTQNSVVNSTPNLSLWLETTADSSFDKGEKSENSIITNWYDLNPQVSTGDNGAQTTAVNKPAYVKNGINKLPALDFDGANDYINVPNSDIINMTNWTIFAVFNVDVNKDHNMLMSKGLAEDNENYEIYFNSAGNLGYTIKYSDNTRVGISASTAIKTNRNYIGTFVNSVNAGASAYINSQAFPMTGGTAGKVPYQNTNSLNIGMDSSVSSRYFDGNIGEVIIFARVLSREERNAIESYLSEKWKIDITIQTAAVATSCSSAPSTLSNGAWTGNPTSGSNGQVVAGSCNSGYSGTPSATCNTGTWSVTGNCALTACLTAPTSLSNGTWNGNPTSGSNGQVVAGTCNSGYTGSPSITCNSGAWSAISGSCTPAGCATAPTAATNGTWNGNPTSGTHGQTVSGTCNSGYTGSLSITCSLGSWSAISGSCTAAGCSTAPTALSNGTWNGNPSSGTSGQVVNGTCNANYTGSPSITCSLGSWSAISGSCTSTGCPTAPPALLLANGTWNATSGTVGQVVTGTCNPGYNVGFGFPAPSITCLGPNWGSRNFSNCNAVTCTQASNGYRTIANASAWSPTVGTISHGVSVNATCNAGYTGTITPMTCSNGTWTGGTGTCTSPNCSAPPALTNGSWGASSATNGQTLTGSCNGGYRSSRDVVSVGGPASCRTASVSFVNPTITCSNGSYQAANGSCLSAASCSMTSTSCSGVDSGFIYFDQTVGHGGSSYASCSYGFGTQCQMDTTFANCYNGYWIQTHYSTPCGDAWLACQGGGGN